MRRPSRRAALAALALALMVAACSKDHHPAAGAAGGSEAAAELSLPVDLYFPGGDGRLYPERREIPASAEPEGQALAVVRELLAGPESSDLVRPFPEGVTVTTVILTPDGVAYVDFEGREGASLPAAGSTEERQRLMSLVDSVALNVSEVRRVVVLWNGVQPESFGGHFDTASPLAPDLSLVARQ